MVEIAKSALELNDESLVMARLREDGVLPVTGFAPVPMKADRNSLASTLLTLDAPDSLDIQRIREIPEVIAVYPDIQVAPFSHIKHR
jgi:hypothetical protein